MSLRQLTAGCAWFAHRRNDRRHLGVRDSQTFAEGFFDLGPQDELALLASGQLRSSADLKALCAGAERVVDEPRFAVPVARPGKILCLAQNYVDHAKEFGATAPTEVVFFAKLQECLLPTGDTIRLPIGATRVDHEIELAAILGFADPEQRGRKRVTVAEAADLVAGYTILNDVTARHLQGDDRKRRWPWLRCKSFDTFCPVGPAVVPRDILGDAPALRLRAFVNDEMRQDGNTKDMVHGVATSIAALSEHTTLRPGDIVTLGTPAGVGPMRAGDQVRGEIEGIGVLQNPVDQEQPA